MYIAIDSVHERDYENLRQQYSHEEAGEVAPESAGMSGSFVFTRSMRKGHTKRKCLAHVPSGAGETSDLVETRGVVRASTLLLNVHLHTMY